MLISRVLASTWFTTAVHDGANVGISARIAALAFSSMISDADATTIR
jgi:hypothetical protein